MKFKKRAEDQGSEGYILYTNNINKNQVFVGWDRTGGHYGERYRYSSGEVWITEEDGGMILKKFPYDTKAEMLSQIKNAKLSVKERHEHEKQFKIVS